MSFEKKQATELTNPTATISPEHISGLDSPTMRLSRSLFGPLRLPPTISEIVRRVTTSSPGASSTSEPASSTVQGWVASLRTSKNVAFVGVNDGTLGRPLQVVVLGKKGTGGLRGSVARAHFPVRSSPVSLAAGTCRLTLVSPVDTS